MALRGEHPAWGGRKISRVLAREAGMAIAPSTVTGVLRRNGVPLGQEGGHGPAPVRFEAEAPNLLWQMDFKGHVAMAQNGMRLHPLTVLDDHSRYALALEACADERAGTVRAALVTTFHRYGLPRRMLMDNGGPWGTAAQGRFSALTVWLIEHGVAVGHSRPLHPQTLGKDERSTSSARKPNIPHARDVLAHLFAMSPVYTPHGGRFSPAGSGDRPP